MRTATDLIAISKQSGNYKKEQNRKRARTFAERISDRFYKAALVGERMEFHFFVSETWDEKDETIWIPLNSCDDCVIGNRDVRYIPDEKNTIDKKTFYEALEKAGYSWLEETRSYQFADGSIGTGEKIKVYVDVK